MGDPADPAVLYFPGLGQDRTACLPYSAAVRLVTIDRPGLGGSEPHRGRTIGSFADDVGEVLDQLAIENVSILGWSAGAPYALACCARMPGRVSAAMLVSPMAPPQLRLPVKGTDPFARGMLSLARRSSALVLGPVTLLRLGAQNSSELLMLALYAGAPKSDREVLNDEDVRRLFKQSYRGATRAGAAGLVTEIALLARDWDIDLGAVDGRRITLMHGTEDRLTPMGVSRVLHERLGSARLDERAGAGHMVLYAAWDSLISDLAGSPDTLPDVLSAGS